MKRALAVFVLVPWTLFVALATRCACAPEGHGEPRGAVRP